MARAFISSPVKDKFLSASTQDKRPRQKSKTRSSIARELFRNAPRPVRDTERRRASRSSKPQSLNSTNRIQPSTRFSPAEYRHPRQSHKQPTDDLRDEVHRENATANTSRTFSVFAGDDDDEEGVPGSICDSDESQENEEDWLDGSTLLAPYLDEDSATEEDRTLELVEYLQVPMEETSQAMKQDLCDFLTHTMNEIRKAHQKLDRGADVDRGKGIVTFNDACDSRHVSTSRAHIELKDGTADNQAEINKLFVLLKQAYARRSQLWVDLKLNIGETIKLQEAALDQLDSNMERTIAVLEKKGKALLKDDTGKDKEKLLRGVLGKL